MKKSVSLVLAALLILIAGAAFSQDYTSALETAKKQNKPVLLYFFSRSCYYCTMMDKTTLTDKGIDGTLKRDFVFLRIDVDKSTDLARLYRISGTPSSWFIESSGKRIGEIPGYVKTADYGRILEYIRGKHYNQTDLQSYMQKASAKK